MGATLSLEAGQTPQWPAIPSPAPAISPSYFEGIQTPTMAPYGSTPYPTTTSGLPEFMEEIGFRILTGQTACSLDESTSIQGYLDAMLTNNNRRELEFLGKGVCLFICTGYPEGSCYEVSHCARNALCLLVLL